MLIPRTRRPNTSLALGLGLRAPTTSPVSDTEASVNLARHYITPRRPSNSRTSANPDFPGPKRIYSRSNNPRPEMTVEITEGEFLWAVGGSTNGDEYATDEVTVYSVAEDRWYSSAEGHVEPMPKAVRAAGWTLWDEKIFCFGGKHSDEEISCAEVQVYDVREDSWTLREEMPKRRSKLGKFYPVVDDRYVFLFGGDTIEGYYDRVAWNWRYDLETDSWDTSPADAPHTQSFPFPSSHDGWLYYLTGNTQRKGPQNDYPGALAQRYHPERDEWQVVAPVPHPVTDGEGDVFEGEFHFVGGWNTNEAFYNEEREFWRGAVERQHVVYDYESNSWRYEDELPYGWHHGGCRATEEYLWRYLGDVDEEDHRRCSDRIFRWDGNEWEEMSPAPVAKWNFGPIYTTIGPTASE